MQLTPCMRRRFGQDARHGQSRPSKTSVLTYRSQSFPCQIRDVVD